MTSAVAFIQCMFMIDIMREVNLSGVDLNLLPMLDALLEERHVTRAARRLGLSQPAASRALGRLRQLLGDPLLVRGRAGLVLTPRAETLRTPLAKLLRELAGLVSEPPSFEPATARGTLRIVTEDYISTVLLPRVLQALWQEAPKLDLDVEARPADLRGQLEAGAVDLAIGVFAEPAAGFQRQALFGERFVCVVRRDHPQVRRKLTLARYAALPHALIGTGERGDSPVDRALAREGLKRRVALRLPHFLAAPLIVAGSDLVLTMPARLAEQMVALAPLRLLAPPVELARFRFSQLWHERRQNDAAHAWFRALVAAQARTLEVPA